MPSAPVRTMVKIIAIGIIGRFLGCGRSLYRTKYEAFEAKERKGAAQARFFRHRSGYHGFGAHRRCLAAAAPWTLANRHGPAASSARYGEAFLVSASLDV